MSVCECTCARVFEFLGINVHLCVFIIVCLAAGVTIKPYLSRNLKLSVPSKNMRLNQCSYFSPVVAARPV